LEYAPSDAEHLSTSTEKAIHGNNLEVKPNLLINHEKASENLSTNAEIAIHGTNHAEKLSTSTEKVIHGNNLEVKSNLSTNQEKATENLSTNAEKAIHGTNIEGKSNNSNQSVLVTENLSSTQPEKANHCINLEVKSKVPTDGTNLEVNSGPDVEVQSESKNQTVSAANTQSSTSNADYLGSIADEQHPAHSADDDVLTQEEKLEFFASIQLPPNQNTQEDDASLHLLLESTANQKDNQEALDVDHEKEVVEKAEYDFLLFLFVGGAGIEKATKQLNMCRGTGISLDKKHSEREEIQVLRLQQAASNGQNTHITLYK
jgi:hypothetical protein